MTEYRALGWKGRESSEVERKTAKQGEAMSSMNTQQKDLQIGIKGNQLQSHFRPQVIF